MVCLDSEIFINIVIVNTVKYTEIDWVAYMQVKVVQTILFSLI